MVRMNNGMDTLFSEMDNEARYQAAPLAVRMRPRAINEIVGQEEAIGPNTWLRRAIANDALSSVILYGPAGTGKTSIAHVIANTTNAAFVEVSAVSGTVSDLRREIKAADERLTMRGQRTILFVDEIHRFSRSQQDALLHAVEDRVVVLIGATTENPFFEVNSALISRSRIVELKPIGNKGIRMVLERALEAQHLRFCLALVLHGGCFAPLVAEHHARRLEPQLRLHGRVGHHGRQLLEDALLLVLEVDHVARSRYEST